MQKKGENYWTNWKSGSILDCDFLLNGLSQDYPVDTPDGKTRAALAFFSYLDALKTDMQKQSSLDMLCQALNLRPDAVLRDYNNRDAARRRIEKRQSDSQSIRLNAELRIMLSVIANFQWFRDLRSALSVDDFEDSLAKEMFIELEDCFRKDSYSVSTLLERFKDESVQHLIEESVMSPEYSNMDVSALEDSIHRIRRNTLEKKRGALLNEIRCLHPRDSEEQNLLDNLLLEKQNIDFELASKN
jgi:DNA primase